MDLGERLGELAVEESRLQRQVREAKEGLTAWTWAQGLQDRTVQRQRQGRRAVVERGGARLAEIAEERRRLQEHIRQARARQQLAERHLSWLASPADELPLPQGASSRPREYSTRQVELRTTMREQRDRLDAIEEKQRRLTSEANRVDRSYREAEEALTTWSFSVSLQDRKVQLQREGWKAQVKQGERRIPELYRRHVQLLEQARSARSRLEQAEAELARTLLPN